MLNKHEMNYQQIFQDHRYNSRVSQFRGESRTCKKDILLSVSIPDYNVHEGEEVFIDNIF